MGSGVFNRTAGVREGEGSRKGKKSEEVYVSREALLRTAAIGKTGK
jgi:hypothetical protein